MGGGGGDTSNRLDCDLIKNGSAVPYVTCTVYAVCSSVGWVSSPYADQLDLFSVSPFVKRLCQPFLKLFQLLKLLSI